MGAPTSTHTQRRGRSALPWGVLALWVIAIALAAPFAGKLGDVQRDRAVDYLPASADSTQAAEIQDKLPGGGSTDLVLVYHRDGGLTSADRAVAERQTGSVADSHTLTAPPQGIPSKDGTTLMYPVSSTEPGQDEEARDAFVNAVREIATDEAGVSVEVGGAGALEPVRLQNPGHVPEGGELARRHRRKHRAQHDPQHHGSHAMPGGGPDL